MQQCGASLVGTRMRAAMRACGAAAVAVAVAAAPARALAPSARIEGILASGSFGQSIASAGDVNGDGYEDVIVGAPSYDDGEVGEGYAFVFHGGPGGIGNGDAADAATVLEGDQASARFGSSVAGAGDVNGDGYDDVIVGAGGYDAGQTDEGAAFVFLGGPLGIASGGVATASAVLESDAVNARIGSVVAGIGDVNGDGFDDVAAGGRLFQSSVDETQEGLVLIFRGSAIGIADGGFATAHARLQGDVAGIQFGDALAGAGDVNGDGFDDVIVGAPRFGNPEVREGAAFLFLGSATGIADGGPSTAAAQLESDQVDAQLGTRVASAGDVDGDGHDDVLVGAPLWDGGQVNEGAALLWRGSPAGIASGNAATASARFEGDQSEAPQVGGSVRGVQMGLGLGAGDTNGDGYDDVLVGAPYYDAGQTDEGAAFLFRGGPGGIATAGAGAATRILEANRNGHWLGSALAFADANDDGFAEALAATPVFSAGLPPQQEGALYVFAGAPNAACENGVDDDGDTDVDLADTGCSASEDRFEEISIATGSEVTIATAQAESVVVHDGPLAAPTTAVLAANGAIAGSLRAIEHSALRVEAGSVADGVAVADEASAVVAGGSVGALTASGAGVIEIQGTGFDRPLGEIADETGTITGTLADGSPFSATFERAATATIRLVPEPGAAALALASLGALTMVARRRRA